MKLSDLEGKAAKIVHRYEYPKAAMLPLLWLVQQGYRFFLLDTAHGAQVITASM